MRCSSSDSKGPAQTNGPGRSPKQPTSGLPTVGNGNSPQFAVYRSLRRGAPAIIRRGPTRLGPALSRFVVSPMVADGPSGLVSIPRAGVGDDTLVRIAMRRWLPPRLTRRIVGGPLQPYNRRHAELRGIGAMAVDRCGLVSRRAGARFAGRALPRAADARSGDWRVGQHPAGGGRRPAGGRPQDARR